MIEAVFAVSCKICCLGLHVTYLVNTAILLQLSIYYLLKCSSIAVPIGHSLNLNDLVFNATVPLSTWTQLCYQCNIAVLQSPLTLYLIPEHRTMHTGSVFFFHNHKHPLHCIADLFLSKGLMSLFVFSYYSCKKTCIFWDLNLTLAGAQCTGSCLWSAQGQVEWRFWAWGIWSSHAASIFPCPACSLQTATPHFSRPSAWTTLND